MFENYTKHVQKHPGAIIAIWVVALIVAIPFAMQAGDVLNYDMTSMGGFDSESADGSEIVGEHFNGELSGDVILAIPYSDNDGLSRIEAGLIDSGELGKALDSKFDGNVGYSVIGSFSNSDSGEGVLLLSFSFSDELSAMNEVGNLRDAISQAKESSGMADQATYVTGSVPIAYDTMEGANKDISRIDPLSIVLIFVLLGLFFWTLVTAAVPPMVVGTSYGIVLAFTYFLGGFLDIFYITNVIVLVSMLGAGCDYCIFIVSRYREERKKGADKDAALEEAVKWAGESVFTSGLAVIIGFAVMSLCTYELVSTMAMVLALGIVMAMLAALTLIPAIIALVGDKVFWPRTIDSYREGSKMRSGAYGKIVETGKRYFSWAGRFSIKHAGAIVAVAILLTVPLGYVAVTSEDSFDMISVMPDSEAKDGVDAIISNADGGLMMPTYVLIELESPIASVTQISDGVGILQWTEAGAGYLMSMSTFESRFMEADSNVSYAMGPTSWAALYQMGYQALVAAGYPAELITPESVNRAVLSQIPDTVSTPLEKFFDAYGWGLTPETVIPLSATMSAPVASLIDYSINIGASLVSNDGMYVQMMVIVKDEPMSQTSMDSIVKAREVMESLAEENTWMKDTWVLGTPATLYDISEVVDSQFHWIEAGVMVLIYILLLVVLCSYFTPLRSLATIMMSVVWTLGVLQLLFAQALSTDVIWIVPIVLFVICLGLGMDYDILLTTRIREGKLKGMSNDEAIADAVARSGSIITLCGLVMGGTFLTLLLSGSAMLQEMGFALGFAILVDSLFVVPYVVPALMHLMGDWSWKGPSFLSKRRMTSQ